MDRKNPVVAVLCLTLIAASAQEEPGRSQPQSALPPGTAAPSADTRRVVSLQEAIDGSLAAGDDMKIANGNLDAAKSLHALNLSKAGITLAAAGSGSVQGGIGDPDLVKSLGSGSSAGLSQNLQGSLSMSQGNASASSPATRLTLTTTQSFPAPPATVTPPSTIVAVSVSQTLWDGYSGGQTRALVDKSLLALGGKEYAATFARASTIARVKQAYVTMLSAQRAIALRQGIAEKQWSLLRQVEAIYSLKQASSIDLMTARINARSAELELEASNHDLSLARQRLANLMGLPPDADFDVAEIDTPGLPAPSAEVAIGVGLAGRADAAQIDLIRKSAAIDLALARGLSQPGIALTGGLNFGFNWDGTAVNAESASLGLRLSLPILDAGAANAQADAAAAQLAVCDAQFAQLLGNIAADIRDNFWLASIQLSRVDLARQNADMLEAQLELVKVQNQFGTATTQDLMTAMTNAANAEAAWAQARGGYLLSILALETAMGL
ncbi:MAG: TolC family protein [Spirochaetes bacterium]|nr:TolC family protein [Spirochaetota bacterium]